MSDVDPARMGDSAAGPAAMTSLNGGHAIGDGPQSPLCAKSPKLAGGLGSTARLEAKLKALASKVKDIQVL